MINREQSNGGHVQRAEILAFTGIRGVAASTVALYHFRREVPSISFPGGVVQNGEYFVDLFFMMSGYVLALSYGMQFAAVPSWREYLKFIGHRLSRIYPAHAVVLLAYLLIPLAYMATQRSLPSDRYDADYFAQSLLLVQNWGFSPAVQWNIPAWSISAEFLFYFAFPLLAHRAARKISLVYLVCTTLTLVALLGLVGFRAGSLAHAIPQIGLSRCIIECCLGICLFHLSSRFDRGLVVSVWLLGVSIAIIGLFALAVLPDYIAIPCSVFCLLWALLNPKNPAAELLALKPVLWLGRVSFATYIAHYLIKDLLKIAVVGQVSDWTALALYVAAVLLASAILHRYVEQPGQRRGRRLVDLLLVPQPQPPDKATQGR